MVQGKSVIDARKVIRTPRERVELCSTCGGHGRVRHREHFWLMTSDENDERWPDSPLHINPKQDAPADALVCMATYSLDVTDRQRAILTFIQQHIDTNGMPPTLREIGAAFGIRSTNGVADHLKALSRKGFVEWSPLLSRSLRLTPKARGAV